MKRIAALLATALAIGCAGRPIIPAPPAPATDKPLARAEVRNDYAAQEITAAKPHADNVGVAHITTATNALTDQASDLKDAQAAVDKERTQYEAQIKTISTDLNAETTKNQKLEGTWYVKAGKFITRMFWVLAGTLTLSLVLRIASQFVTGPVGAIMSFASTGIFGVFSGGISLVQSMFDNLWLRGVSPAAKTTGAK